MLINKSEEIIVVFDVDGTLTDGKMYYTAEGKAMKAFGPDDWDLLKELHKHFEVYFVSADKKGFPITERRIKTEMGWNLELVSHNASQRLRWMREKAGNKRVIYMGDGANDGFLPKANDVIFITTQDALDHTKLRAYQVMKHRGGERAVAEACIWIMDNYSGWGLAWRELIE